MNDPLALIAHAGIAKTVCEVDGLDGVQAQTQESGKISTCAVGCHALTRIVIMPHTLAFYAAC